MPKRKRNRNRQQRARQRPRYEAKLTPTHVVRLERIKVQVDPSRKWYVVRTEAKREREVGRSLKAAGFVTHPVVEASIVVRKGRAVELQRRPAAGYLFVGIEEGQDGRAALWRFHDQASGWSPEGARVRPFYRVMGPFGPETLQRFVDRLSPPPVAVLWSGGQRVAAFPAAVTGLVEGESLHLTDFPTGR